LRNPCGQWLQGLRRHRTRDLYTTLQDWTQGMRLFTSVRRLQTVRRGRWFSGHRLVWISGGAVLLMGIIGLLGPIVEPYKTGAAVANGLLGPVARHPFGTDEYGRDILSRVLYGMRISIGIGFGAAIAAAIVGTLTGLYSGYRRGWPDSVITRVQDFLLGFPPLILAMIIVGILGPSVLTPLIAAVVAFFPLFGRVIRSSALVERNKEYVLASRALGASPRRILLRTLLPTVLPVVYVQAAIVAAVSVQLEASLSFLGVGVPPPTPSLGSMLSEAEGFVSIAPFYAIFPGLALAIVIGGLVVFANGLGSRQAVNIVELEEFGKS
jgi:peptide/nickel transport system permease protein